ncbi:DMT family transporter [Rheinheimera tilapiae]|uniref:DMT family transporter n=1 Tax=Rheinheimera tilapiae TaxID=875043 RepID=A0ABV6BC79_9GAMM
MNLYLIFALISAVSMASSGVIARMSGLAAAELTFYRLFVGALCLLGLVLLLGKQAELKQKPDRRIVLNGILLASFMLCFLKAISFISLANAIMLVYLAPALAAIAAHFLFHEKLDLASGLLIVLSFLGFAMLQQFKLDLVLTEAQWPGFVYGMLSLFTYTGFLLANRHSGQSESPLQRAFYQLMIGALCVLPFLNATPLPNIDELPWVFLAGFFPGFLAIYLAIIALEHLPTRVFGTLAYIEPVAVILAGWWLFQEKLSLLQVGGVALILLAGLVQSVLHQQPARERAAA